MHFDISSTYAPPAAYLRVAGEVDLSGITLLTAALRAAMADDCSELSLDLGDVSFIDCASLGALVGIRNEIDRIGGRVEIGPASPVVERMLRLARLEGLLMSPAA